MPLPLETDRLILRPFEARDLPSFVAYRSDPAVARYQSWEAPYTMEQAIAFLEKMRQVQPGAPGQWFQVAVEMKASGHLIGDCAFCVQAADGRQAEIGFTLAPGHQGQGYATEAATALLDRLLFGALGLHRVFAVHDVENVASGRVLERLGMRQEGYFVESYWHKGRWASEHWHAILRSEWSARR